MEKFRIEGGRPLRGRVVASGAKNAALPILASTVLADGECRLEGIPEVSDVKVMLELLGELGVEGHRTADGAIVTRVVDATRVLAPYEIVRRMRASICLLGPLLARRRTAIVSLPGGCVIGHRPIDLHIKAMRALGATVGVEGGYVHATAESLSGGEMFLGGPKGSTVLGTANALMAATLARGRTVIQCAACEPEMIDLAEFLQAMGARIEGAGTSELVVEGVERLEGTCHRVIPDRIESGTYLVAAALTRGDVTLAGARPDHLGAVIGKLREIGAEVEVRGEAREIRVTAPRSLRAVDITTAPYPGFPTDMQSQLTTLLSLCEGTSIVRETIYPERFMHVPELCRMGARIRREGPQAVIEGVDSLSGAPVMASDLRASAGLVLAGLVARGTTLIDRIYHIDRGYEGIEQKLAGLGASIRRVAGGEAEAASA